MSVRCNCGACIDPRLHLTVLTDSNTERDWIKIIDTSGNGHEVDITYAPYYQGHPELTLWTAECEACGWTEQGVNEEDVRDAAALHENGDAREWDQQFKDAIWRAVADWLATGVTVHPLYPCPRCLYWPSPVDDVFEFLRGCEHECHTYKERR